MDLIKTKAITEEQAAIICKPDFLMKKIADDAKEKTDKASSYATLLHALGTSPSKPDTEVKIPEKVGYLMTHSGLRQAKFDYKLGP